MANNSFDSKPSDGNGFSPPSTKCFQRHVVFGFVQRFLLRRSKGVSLYLYMVLLSYQMRFYPKSLMFVSEVFRSCPELRSRFIEFSDFFRMHLYFSSWTVLCEVLYLCFFIIRVGVGLFVRFPPARFTPAKPRGVMAIVMYCNYQPFSKYLCTVRVTPKN